MGRLLCGWTGWDVCYVGGLDRTVDGGVRVWVTGLGDWLIGLRDWPIGVRVWVTGLGDYLIG